MFKPFTCLLLLLFVATIVGKTQPTHVRDSLLQLLPKAKEDTNKVLIMYGLARFYQMNNQDSSRLFMERFKALSDKLHYTKGIYRYHEQNVVLYYTKGKYDSALTEGEIALKIARNQLKDSIMVASTLGNMGMNYGFLGRYNDQLTASLKAAKLFEGLKDSSRLTTMYHNLANCYADLSQYKKSLDYALLSIRLSTAYKIHNTYIGRVYSAAGQAYQKLRNYDSALYCFNVAIVESKKVNDEIAVASIHAYKAGLFALMNDFHNMQQSANQSLVMAQQLQSNSLQASSLNTLALANLYNGNNAQAKNFVQQALIIAGKDSMIEDLQNTYSTLSYVAAAEKDFRTLVSAKETADSLERTALNNEVIKTSADLEKKYETEKKEIEIQQLQADKKVQELTIRQKNTLNYILIASGIVLLFIFILLYRNYHQKQKLQQQRINELEAEKQLAATEAVLKGEELERTRMAKDLHDGLGGMLSGIKYSLNTMKGNMVMTQDNAQAFERSIDMLDSSIKEMRRVAHNMMPETLVRFGLDAALKDFCNDINQSGALAVNYQSFGMDNTMIDQTIAITIYRIVQELMNNTMKHAGARNAIVQVTKTNGQLQVTVEDDGKGFDTSILKSVKGIGWSNIQNRVEFLKGKLDVSSEPGKGTSVLIEMNT